MKLFLLIVPLMIFSSTLCDAQIKKGIKGLKDKVSDKTSIVTGESDKTETVKVNTNGVPEYDPEDPTYRAYSTVRDELKSTRSLLNSSDWKQNVEGRNDDATRYLKKVQDNLAKLQSDPIESKKSYVKDFEKDYDEVEALRKSKFDSYTADQEWDQKIEAYYKFAVMDWGIQDESLEPSYTGYYNMKKEFETTRPEKYASSYVQKRIAAVDNFFQVEVYEVVPDLNEDVDNVIAHIHAKNSSGDEDYLLNAESYVKDFEKIIPRITYNRKYLLENKTDIDAVQAKMDKEKAILDEYIASGKYEEHRAKFHQALLDAVRLSPKKMSNPTYESMAKSGVDKGEVLRVVITNNVWNVHKTDWGYAEYKYLSVDIAVSYNGKCFLAYGQIRKSYEGGGVYGGEFFNYWGLQEEMNCDNINK